MVYFFLYASKQSESNHGDVKSDITEIYGICLFMSEKMVCLKANQGSNQHSNVYYLNIIIKCNPIGF